MNGFNANNSFKRLQEQFGFHYAESLGNPKYLCGYLRKIHNDVYAYVMIHGSKYHSYISFINLYIMIPQRLDDAINKDSTAYKIEIGNFENYDFENDTINDFIHLCEDKIIALIPSFVQIGIEVKNRFDNFQYLYLKRHNILKFEKEIYEFVKNDIFLFEQISEEIRICISKKIKLTRAVKLMSEKMSIVRLLVPDEYLKSFYFENTQNEESLAGEIIFRLYIEILCDN